MLALQVKGTGELLVFCSKRPERCVVNGTPAEFDYQPTKGAVVLSLTAEASNCVVTV